MKTLKQLLLIGCAITMQYTCLAQVQYYHEATDETFLIQPTTDDSIIQCFLNQFKALEIDFNPDEKSKFPLRLKNKKGNWVLFDSHEQTLFMQKESAKYSFQFPGKDMKYSGTTLATRKGKTYIVLIENENIDTKRSFDEIRPRMKTVVFKDFNFETEEMHESPEEVFDALLVKKNDKWGLIEYAENSLYLSHGFLYDDPDKVPPSTGFQSHQLQMVESIRKIYNVVDYEALDDHGYFLKGKNEKSQLFGLYVGEGEPDEKIPPHYTNIVRHINTETYEVWKENKVGYYNSEFVLVIEPVYDEFEYIHLDHTYGCALKTNDKWELFNAFTGEKLVNGSAATTDELIELWLNRHKD